jgi:MFS family permease
MAVDAAERRRVLAAVALGASLGPFMVSGLLVALPAVGREFGLSASDLTWVGTVFFLSAGAFLLPFGRLGDILGVRRLFTTGIGIFALTAALSALAPSAPALVAARAATGVGAAMVFGTALAFASLVSPEEERGRAVGTVVAMLMIGFAAGTVTGGVLTDLVSWRALFVPGVAIAAGVTWYTARVVKVECALSRDRRFDRTGSALWAGALLALMVGLSTLPAWSGALLAAAGAGGLALFVRHERRQAVPLLDLALLRRPCFGIGNLAVLVFYAGTFAPGLLLSLYLQEIAGYSARTASLFLVVSPVVMALLSRPAGRAADRVDPRAVAALGTMLAAAALVLLGVLAPESSLSVILAILVLIGAGPALFAAPLVRVILAPIGREQYALASSAEESMRLVGQTLALGSAAAVFGLVLGGVPAAAAPPGALLGAIRLIAWFDLALVALALVALLLLRPATAVQPTGS